MGFYVGHIVWALNSGVFRPEPTPVGLIHLHSPQTIQFCVKIELSGKILAVTNMMLVEGVFLKGKDVQEDFNDVFIILNLVLIKVIKYFLWRHFALNILPKRSVKVVIKRKTIFHISHV